MRTIFIQNCTPITRVVDSPLGPLLLAATPLGLAGVWFEGQQHFPAPASTWPPADALATPAHSPGADGWLDTTAEWLGAYFHGQPGVLPLPSVPLAPLAGTPFQRAVWQALQTIPAGRTCTYGELAQALGRPSASRAVGAAVGRNPWSVLVPCHRVVGTNGQLTGYAGGLARKQWLLQHER